MRFSFNLPFLVLITGIAVVPVLVVGSPGYSQQRPPSGVSAAKKAVDQHINEGKKQLKNGRYGNAIRHFSAAIKRDPNAGQAYKLRGWAYDRAGFSERSLKDFTRYIKLNPSDPVGYLLRGDTHNFYDEHEAALADYDKAISAAGDWVDAHLGRGLALVGLGRHSEAIKEYEWVLKKEPQNAEALSNMGRAYMLSGKTTVAQKFFGKALEVEKDSKWKRQIEWWVEKLSQDPALAKEQPSGPFVPPRRALSMPLW